jgi:hypothetical protein
MHDRILAVYLLRHVGDPRALTGSVHDLDAMQMWALQPTGNTTISLAEIRDCLPRHYQLRFVAIELFFTSRTTMFLNLFTQVLPRNL